MSCKEHKASSGMLQDLMAIMQVKDGKVHIKQSPEAG